jgi:hypothetical protein
MQDREMQVGKGTGAAHRYVPEIQVGTYLHRYVREMQVGKGTGAAHRYVPEIQVGTYLHRYVRDMQVGKGTGAAHRYVPVRRKTESIENEFVTACVRSIQYGHMSSICPITCP